MDANWIFYAALGAATVILIQALERRFLRKAAEMLRDAREIEALRKVKYAEPERPRYDETE